MFSDPGLMRILQNSWQRGGLARAATLNPVLVHKTRRVERTSIYMKLLGSRTTLASQEYDCIFRVDGEGNNTKAEVKRSTNQIDN